MLSIAGAGVHDVTPSGWLVRHLTIVVAASSHVADGNTHSTRVLRMYALPE